MPSKLSSEPVLPRKATSAFKHNFIFAPCSPDRGRSIVGKLLWFWCCRQRRSTICTYRRSREGGHPGRNQEATAWNKVCGGSNRRNHKLRVNVVATTKDVSTVIKWNWYPYFKRLSFERTRIWFVARVGIHSGLTWNFIMLLNIPFFIRTKELEVEVCKLKCEVISLIQASIKIPLKGKQWKMMREISLVICGSVLFFLFYFWGRWWLFYWLTDFQADWWTYSTKPIKTLWVIHWVLCCMHHLSNWTRWTD